MKIDVGQKFYFRNGRPLDLAAEVDNGFVNGFGMDDHGCAFVKSDPPFMDRTKGRGVNEENDDKQ